jgi:hypothetical protein
VVQRDRRGKRPCAVLTLWLGFVAPAAATDDKTREEARTVLFGGLDVGRSVFISAGRKQALGACLDESGTVFMLTAASGRKRERDSVLGSMTVRQAAEASALLGYNGCSGARSRRLSSAPSSTWRRGTGSASRSPTIKPAPAPASSARSGATRARTCFSTRRRSPDRRAGMSGRGSRPDFAPGRTSILDRRRPSYREGRLGLHATGVELGSFVVRLSGGWRRDEERDRSGPYVGLWGHWRP